MFRQLLFIVAFLTYGICGGCRNDEARETNATAQVAEERNFAVAVGAAIKDVPPIAYAPTDWPRWRGPLGNGHAPDSATPPLTWGESENVLWKIDLPGNGHASPVVHGQSIFIVAADEQANSQSLYCLDRDSGAQVWQVEVHRGPFVRKHSKNSHASATPVCDGKYVYTVFANDGGVFASAIAAADGMIVWQQRIGDYESEHGYGSAPVIHRSALIVAGDHMGDGGGYVAAVDRFTGEPIWKTPRKKSGTNANYCTPLVAQVAGKSQLLLHGYDRVISYDPDTGREIWRVDGPTDVCANTIIAGDDHIYASGGYPGKKHLCIRADGTGDVTDTHVQWTDIKGVAYVPSGILHNGRLYVVSDPGISSSYNAQTGQEVWRQRLDGAFTSSLVLAAGRLYISSEQGVTYVIEASDKGRILARNTLPGVQLATPAFSGGRIYIRTDTSLYCIGQ